MRTKKRLKKGVYYVIIGIILLIIAACYGKKKYDEYEYQKTYEYKLIEHGYTKDEVTTLIDVYKGEEYLEFFLNNKVNEKYISLTKEKYFLKKNFYQYADYIKMNRRMELENVIRIINNHLDKDFYEVSFDADISLNTKVLANKFYLLKSDYEPTDLVTISQDYSWGALGSQKVRQVAYDAFLDMHNAAKEKGYYLMVNSSYRSYNDQESVYNEYKKLHGEKYADGIAARPGSSEHQTGLALDIFSKKNSNKATFKDTKEAKWLAKNAHKYGFILRYPEDKVKITGYNYESWHFRYVGKEIATYIYENNISFEEYYSYFIEK